MCKAFHYLREYAISYYNIIHWSCNIPEIKTNFSSYSHFYAFMWYKLTIMALPNNTDTNHPGWTLSKFALDRNSNLYVTK